MDGHITLVWKAHGTGAGVSALEEAVVIKIRGPGKCTSLSAETLK